MFRNIVMLDNYNCDAIHEKVPSLSSGVRASATYVNDY